jgi:uncharacterized protein
MPAALFTSDFPVTREALFAWHERPGAFRRLAPPWARAEFLEECRGLPVGGRVVFEVRRGPLRATWIARITACEPGRSFVDELERGPLRAWRHEHRFLDAAPGSRLEDRIEYRLPAGASWIAGAWVRRQIDRLFTYRHARLRFDLARQAAWEAHRGSAAPLSIAVSGSSGSIGGPLCDVLTTCGHRVVRLVRHKPMGPDQALLQPGAGPRGGQLDPDALEGLDAIVHLAGESLFKGRWTKARAARARDSRIEGTRLLASALAAAKKPPGALVVASATGVYGDQGDQELHETAGVGSGYLAELARDWEQAAEPARQAGIRVVHLRLGLVLGMTGGVLPALRRPFSLGLGAIPGDGDQWWSWVSLDDTITVVLRCLTDQSLHGPINVVAPHPVRARDFCATLAGVLDRGLLARVPAWAMRAAGPRGEWVLASARGMPAALNRAGFTFAHPTLDDALRWELGLAATAARDAESA